MSPMRFRAYFGFLLAIAGAVLLLSIPTAQADTIFNNFGDANSYNGSVGWSVAGAASAAGMGFQSAAMPFTPSGTAALTEIEVAISNSSGTNSVALTLNSDSGGLPGGVLMSWSLNSLPAFGACCSVEAVTPSSPVTLASGTQYWIVASVIAADTADAWNWNNTGSTGLLALNNGSGFFSHTGPVGAFDVQGTPVPEPSSLILLGTGMLAIAGAVRRSCLRISVN